MIIAGVDPGATGAIAIYDTGLGTLRVLDMPTEVHKIGATKRLRVSASGLGVELANCAIDEAVIEQVQARPRQGVASMFHFGRSLGVVEGVFAGQGVPLRLMRPQQWQRLVRVAGGEHVKDHARDRAVMLFPAYAGLFGRKKDSGRADAALIAYARALELGEVTWPS